MTVGGNTIGGTLKYIEGYTSAFSGDEANGNFLALHFASGEEGTTIKTKVLGGDHGEVTLDPDGICIFRIKNTTQQIQVTVSKTGYENFTKRYSLSGLTLQLAS